MIGGIEANKTSTLTIADLIPEGNKPPTTPIISAWPEETTIKKNRNVTLTATSQDPNNDEIEYV